jgi:phosphatidylinositol alpha-1,6-mannosyltransferase
MERLNLHMALELAKEFEITVIGPQGCRSEIPNTIGLVEVAAKPLWRFFCGALRRAISVARGFRPHVVLAGSGLVAPFAWLAARISGARMAVYVHGLDIIEDHPIYRWCWRPFIRRADFCIANSRNTARLAMDIGVPESRITIVHPGVDRPAAETGENDFRARFALGDRPLMLSIGRLIARKGLLEFVENALPRVVDAVPNACLVVLGEELPDLLHGSSAGLAERIRSRARSLEVEHNVLFIGTQDDETLAKAYRAADVHIFPVRDVVGDVEGFGMVAVEAAAHGLPTIAFTAGGVPDAVADGISGTLVPADDYATLSARVIGWLNNSGDSDARQLAVGFAERFYWEIFGNTLRKQLRDIALMRSQE